MRHTTTIACAAAIAAAAGCGGPAFAPTASNGGAIINGEPIGSDEFPSASALIFQGTVDVWGQQMPMCTMMCTATLISPDVVLTAGHCVDEWALTMGMGTLIDPLYCVSFEEDLTWMAEDPNMNPPLPDDAVCGSHWVQHPDFDLTSMQEGPPAQNDDIALLFLDEPIWEVPFSYLPDADEAEQIVEEMEVDIVGYGLRTAEAGNWWEPPDPETSYERYWARTFINELGDHEMQVGSDNTTGRKCHGDSGGPTFVAVETDLSVAERVIGVTSRAYTAAEDCNIGGIDTRVSPYLGWIEEQMLAACDEGWRDEEICDDGGGLPRPDPVEEADDDDGDDDDAATDDDGAGDGCACALSPRRPAASLPLVAALGALLARRRRS